MLITDIDTRLRQADLWPAGHPEATAEDPRPANAIFIAIYPDPPTARRIGRLAWGLCKKHQLNVRPLADRRFHISLYAIGDYARPRSDPATAIQDALGTITMPPFSVAFDQAVSFKGGRNRPLVLIGGDGLAGLMLLQRELAAALGKTGIGPRNQPPYHPHITLLYDERQIEDEPVEAIGWMVSEIVLVRSLRGQGRHVPLARWPLRG